MAVDWRVNKTGLAKAGDCGDNHDVKSRILLALLSAIVAWGTGGCAHSNGGGPVSQAGENRDYRILENVHDEEWKPVSLVTILEDGRYLWVVRDVWSVPPRDHTFSGMLSEDLLQRLKADEGKFTQMDGQRVYVLRQGEETAEIPPGILETMQLLRKTHFPSP